MLKNIQHRVESESRDADGLADSPTVDLGSKFRSRTSFVLLIASPSLAVKTAA